jgi:hypothetical protein
VIANNDDDESKKVEGSFSVEELKRDAGEVVYRDSERTFLLIVKPAEAFDGLIGELSLLADGPGGKSIEKMDCFKENEISFDGQIPAKKPQKQPKKELRTEITCRQEDGDQVRTVGIVQEARGLSALVVDQNFDDKTLRLVHSIPVTLDNDAPKQSVWTGKRGAVTLTLTVKENVRRRLVGELEISDGSNEPLTGLECIPNDKITFDAE